MRYPPNAVDMVKCPDGCEPCAHCKGTGKIKQTHTVKPDPNVQTEGVENETE